MAYKKVVEMLGERLASVLELLKKWLIDWAVDTDKLLHFAHQMRKEDVLGLLEETHKVVRIEKGKVQKVGVLSATIDLDAKPGLPCDGATIEKHIGGGKVVIEKRADGLYIDDKKVILYRSMRQMNRKSILGHVLRKELDGGPVLNACIMDFLMGNPGFIPEDWKKDDAGNTIYIFFWGTIFCGSSGSLCVRDFYFRDGQWQQDGSFLSYDWDGRSLAALLAS